MSIMPKNLILVFAIVVTLSACNFAKARPVTHHSGQLAFDLPKKWQTSHNVSSSSYNCWTSTGSLKDCLPFVTFSTPVLDAADIVRAVKGTVNSGVNVFMYEFNVSTLLHPGKETLHHMYVQLNKQQLNWKMSDMLMRKCGALQGIPLNITVQSFSGDTVISTFKSTIIMKLKEMSTVDLTEATKSLYDSLRKTEQKCSRVSLTLTIGGYWHNQTALFESGLFSEVSTVWMVTFSSKFDTNKVKMFGERIYQIAKDTHYAKRQAASEFSQESEASTTDESPCRMYTQWVSFSVLESGETVIRPQGFHVNYCFGVCRFPQVSSPKYNTTKHSHIQSIASHYNPAYVPTSCCVPHEYSDVEILYEQESGVLTRHTFAGIAAKSCGCK